IPNIPKRDLPLIDESDRPKKRARVEKEEAAITVDCKDNLAIIRLLMENLTVLKEGSESFGLVSKQLGELYALTKDYDRSMRHYKAALKCQLIPNLQIDLLIRMGGVAANALNPIQGDQFYYLATRT